MSEAVRVASGECLVSSEAGLRIVEARPARFGWNDVRGRVQCGVAEPRAEVNVLALVMHASFLLYAVLLLALVVIGAFAVAASVHHACQHGLSFHAVGAEVAKRMR